MRLCFESRLYLYLLYWSVNSRKCSLWKTWGEGMFSWTYIHTGSDILSIHSTPRMDIYLCSMVSCRCCQSAWTDIVICLRNILQDYTPLSQATAAKYQTLRSFVLCLVLDTTAWSECVGVSTAWTDPGIPLRWDVRGHLNSRQQHVCGQCRGDTAGSRRSDMKMESIGFANHPKHVTSNFNGICTNIQNKSMGFGLENTCAKPWTRDEIPFFPLRCRLFGGLCACREAGQSGRPWFLEMIFIRRNHFFWVFSMDQRHMLPKLPNSAKTWFLSWR